MSGYSQHVQSPFTNNDKKINRTSDIYDRIYIYMYQYYVYTRIQLKNLPDTTTAKF